MKLTFLENIEHAKLSKSDSLLIVGKAKDLRKIECSHLSRILADLEIPEPVINLIINYLYANSTRI